MRHASRLWNQAAAGSAKHRIVFADQLLATLGDLHYGSPHLADGHWAIGEVRPLLAEQGCTISPDVRLRILAEAVDYPAQAGKIGLTKGTEIGVHHPLAMRTGTASSPARSVQNAVKTMVFTLGDR